VGEDGFDKNGLARRTEWDGMLREAKDRADIRAVVKEPHVVAARGIVLR
jgi:hypothetical protein